MTEKIPIVILGGSGGQPTQLPSVGDGFHPITGYKGIDLRIGGRALISHLIDRIAASEGFGRISIAGPSRIYGESRPHFDVVDTDGDLGANVRAAVRAVAAPTIAFIACDVLPSAQELRQLATAYAEAAPTPLWFPLVGTPRDDLGASSWKPGYQFRVEKSERILDKTPDSITVFPGHLVIAQPQHLRMAFFYRLTAAVYAARNQTIPQKSRILITRLIPALIWEDLKGICRGRLPTYGYRMIRTGVSVTQPMRDGQLTIAEAAAALTKLTVVDPSTHAVALPVVDIRSLATDIDTEEEAHQIGAVTRSDLGVSESGGSEATGE